MTVGATLVTNGIITSTVDQSAYASGSITFAGAGNLVIVAFAHSVASGSIGDATSIVSTALTDIRKEQVIPYNTFAAPTKKIEVWSAISTGSTDTVTINLPDTPTGLRGYVVEFTGVNLSTGSHGIVTRNNSIDFSNAGTTTATAGMLPFVSTASAVFAIASNSSNTAFTNEGGYTLINDGGIATPNMRVAAEFLAANDLTPSFTLSSAPWGFISVEIADITTAYAPPVTIQAPPNYPHPASKTGPFAPRSRETVDTQATITGTSSTTNANDTSAAAGTTTVTGTLAKTNANDTSAAAGTSTVVGTLARTNANDTSAAAGTTTVTGTLAKTNANDTSAAAGSPIVNGTLARTNANDTSAASGSGTVTGTSATTNNNDTSSASGVVTTPTVETATTGAGGKHDIRSETRRAWQEQRELDELEALIQLEDEELLVLL